MSNRIVLGGFAVLVLAGIIALIIAIRGGGESVDGAAAETGPVTADRTGATADPAGEPPARRDRPAVEPAGDDDDDTGGDGPLIYTTDAGVLVRDHRKNATVDPRLAELPRARGDRKPHKMQPESVLAVRGALRPVVRRCQRELPADQLGEAPTLQAVVTVDVQEGQLTVKDMVISTEDAPTEAIADCVRSGFDGHAQALAGEPDVTDFKLTFPFRLR